jgi:glycerophosphoryl diester phosphodiesterase
MLDSKTVGWAKERGYRIHTWTVDDPGTMWQLMRLGVDLIITNRPDVLRQVIRTRSAKRPPVARPDAPSPSPAGG